MFRERKIILGLRSVIR